jgi:hypothetical protein
MDELLQMSRQLMQAGSQIRSRKLEWQKTNGNQDTISLGNVSSYLSMALADASLYQSSHPSLSSPRSDIESFKSLYGIGPDFVWKLRHCKRFIDFVNWCADLKYFQAHPADGGFFPSTRAQRWAARILTDMEHNSGYFTTRGLNEYFEDGHLGKSFYEELKNEHAVAMDKYNEHANNRWVFMPA